MGDGKTPLRDLVWLLPAMAVVLQCAFVVPLLQLNAAQSQILGDTLSAANNSADAAPSASQNTHREPRQKVLGPVSGEGAITAKGAIGRALIRAKLAQRQSARKLVDKVQSARIDKRSQVITSLEVDGDDIDAELARQLVSYKPSFEGHIEYLDQNPIMISGCEIVALTVVLHSMGFKDAEPKDIADNYLEKGSDLKTQYTGSPYGIGGGFAPCIVKAANKWLAYNVGGLKLQKPAADAGKVNDVATIKTTAIPQAHDLTGSSFKSVRELVKLGYPVLVWVTEGMVEPSISGDWYDPEHCVVVYGVKGDDMLVSDSLAGLVKRDAKEFGDIYEKCGKRAAFIAPAPGASGNH